MRPPDEAKVLPSGAKATLEVSLTSTCRISLAVATSHTRSVLPRAPARVLPSGEKERLQTASVHPSTLPICLRVATSQRITFQLSPDNSGAAAVRPSGERASAPVIVGWV